MLLFDNFRQRCWRITVYTGNMCYDSSRYEQIWTFSLNHASLRVGSISRPQIGEARNRTGQVYIYIYIYIYIYRT